MSKKEYRILISEEEIEEPRKRHWFFNPMPKERDIFKCIVRADDVDIRKVLQTIFEIPDDQIVFKFPEQQEIDAFLKKGKVVDIEELKRGFAEGYKLRESGFLEDHEIISIKKEGAKKERVRDES